MVCVLDHVPDVFLVQYALGCTAPHDGFGFIVADGLNLLAGHAGELIAPLDQRQAVVLWSTRCRVVPIC